MQQLLLEVDGVGGDNHALPLGQCEQGRRQQVGHGFAHARSTFHYQVLPIVDGSRDGSQHFFLLGPVFEPFEYLGEGTVPA